MTCRNCIVQPLRIGLKLYTVVHACFSNETILISDSNLYYLFHEDDQLSTNENFGENGDNADVVHGDCSPECDDGKTICRINK